MCIRLLLELKHNLCSCFVSLIRYGFVTFETQEEALKVLHDVSNAGHYWSFKKEGTYNNVDYPLHYII